MEKNKNEIEKKVYLFNPSRRPGNFIDCLMGNDLCVDLSRDWVEFVSFRYKGNLTDGMSFGIPSPDSIEELISEGYELILDKDPNSKERPLTKEQRRKYNSAIIKFKRLTRESEFEIRKNKNLENKFNLEDKFKEVVEIYRQIIQESLFDPNIMPYGYLGNLLGGYYGSKDSSNGAKNNFESQVFLIQRMREAYKAEDKNMFLEIPLVGGRSHGTNTVTFDHMNSKCYLPFHNETCGENVYWIQNQFMRLEDFSGPTEFYEYLNEKIEEFEQERDIVMGEILSSSSFTEAMVKEPNPSWEDKINVLIPPYRDEEFKRKDRVLDLCDKVGHVYELASRLFEELRPEIDEVALKIYKK